MKNLSRSTPSGDDLSASTSMNLLAQAKIGDPDAWRRLVDLYASLVYGWCRQRGVHADDAADVTQDVFVAVSKNLKRFRRDRPGDTFRGWLWKITYSKICDHFRRRGNQAQAQGGTDAQMAMGQIPSQLPDDSATEIHDSSANTLDRRAMELARAGFEDHTWRAFWRVVVDGCSVADVAEELRMSNWAVYKAKSRVTKRLREILDASLD